MEAQDGSRLLEIKGLGWEQMVRIFIDLYYIEFCIINLNINKGLKYKNKVFSINKFVKLELFIEWVYHAYHLATAATSFLDQILTRMWLQMLHLHWPGATNNVWFIYFLTNIINRKVGLFFSLSHVNCSTNHYKILHNIYFQDSASAVTQWSTYISTMWRPRRLRNRIGRVAYATWN